VDDERDWHQEYKDDLAQGLIYADGSPRDTEPPDDWPEGSDWPDGDVRSEDTIGERYADDTSPF